MHFCLLKGNKGWADTQPHQRRDLKSTLWPVNRAMPFSLIVLRTVNQNDHLKFLFLATPWCCCRRPESKVHLFYFRSVEQEPSEYHWPSNIHQWLLTHTKGLGGLFVISISTDMVLYNKWTKTFVYDNGFQITTGEASHFEFPNDWGIPF